MYLKAPNVQMYYCTRDSRSKLVSLLRKEDYIHSAITLRKVCFLMRELWFWWSGPIAIGWFYDKKDCIWKHLMYKCIIVQEIPRSKLVSLRRKEDYIHAPITLRKVCFLMRRTGEVEVSKYTLHCMHYRHSGVKKRQFLI